MRGMQNSECGFVRNISCVLFGMKGFEFEVTRLPFFYRGNELLTAYYYPLDVHNPESAYISYQNFRYQKCGYSTLV